MKVLHFSTHYRISSGIVNQIAYEQNAALSLGGVQWSNVIFTCQGKSASYVVKSNYPGGRLVNYLLGRLTALYWLARNAKKYDLILLRHNLGDPFEFIASKLLKRYVTVHHTLEMDEARTIKGLGGQIQYHLEKTLGRAIIRRAIGVIGVTHEIIEHECQRVGQVLPTHVYPNGIDCKNHIVTEDKRDNIPRFLFVAAEFTPWHGLDRILQALAEDSTNCEVHVVGRCQAEQIVQMGRDSRFHYHGEQSFQQIQALSTLMDVGISSLALERKGMKEACTLKVREYLVSGLPVFSGHIDAALPIDFPYYRNGRPVLAEMIQFVKEMRGISRAVVREHAHPYIDKTMLVKSLADWLHTILAQEKMPKE